MRQYIAPSILSADFARLGDQVRAVDSAGADLIHVDVMDGHLVPNLSMGPAVVQALRRVTDVPLDVHLMLTDPAGFLEVFAEAGASHISVHVEANGDLGQMFDWMRDRGIGRGIVVNPETDVSRVFDLLPVVDMVLIMTCYPGFGGQSFLGEHLEKVRLLRGEEARLRDAGQRKNGLDIEVDGGIDETTIVRAREAGANVFVAGSTVFGDPDPGAAVARLKQAVGNE